MSRRLSDERAVSETLETGATAPYLPTLSCADAAAPDAPTHSLPAVIHTQTAQQLSKVERPPADLLSLDQRPTLLRLPALTSQNQPALPPPDQLQLIPATAPSPGILGAKLRQAAERLSPRFPILKFSLVGVLLLAILAATLTTAGGGKIDNLLFSAFHDSAPAPTTPAPPTSTPITQNVRPIIQADINAGYTSRRQHDLFWNASCSAASFTEVVHAWGKKDITIGQVIDEMSSHDPPYITSYAGLMSWRGWLFMAERHGFKADVQFQQAFSYEKIVETTMQQGLPVIVGIRDTVGRYYAGLSGGHYIVVVGGDSNGLKIVDSSLYRIKYLDHDKFIYLWSRGRGMTILLTPAS